MKLPGDGMGYKDLIKPIWDTVSIYDGPETFLAQYSAAPEAARTLFAAHWCQSEVQNGGFEQFFANSTGVLAPEAVEAFVRIGMPEVAKVVDTALGRLGSPYPRDQEKREVELERISALIPEDDYSAFDELDGQFYQLLKTEAGGFVAAADSFALRMRN